MTSSTYDVYQCVISPDKLEQTIHEAEQNISGRRYVLISSEAYPRHRVRALQVYAWRSELGNVPRRDDSEHLCVFLHNKGIEFEALTDSSPDDPDS